MQDRRQTDAAAFMESVAEAVHEAAYSRMFAEGISESAERSAQIIGGVTVPEPLKALRRLATAAQNRAKAFEGYICRAEELLGLLKPLESTVLRLHYLQGISWDAVADETGYSYDGLMKVRRRALKALEAVMKA